MFLLFLSSARRKRSLRQFTFQYVSIISDVSDLERKLLMRFTFQYVSIISLLSPRHSFLPEAHLHSNMFLLFRDFLFLLLSLPTYLHSNMFLLFPFCSLPVSVLLRHLHSNMFLLFLYIAERLILCVQNLHSNMFLLFLFFPNFISIYNPIYIPICFYYFKIYPQSVTTQIRFTFQYVSIISKKFVAMLLVGVNLHSNMFLLFPKCRKSKAE